MKTFAIKSTIFTMIFTFWLVLAYIFVKWRNWLQATDGDTLWASQWNQLVTKVDTLEWQVSNINWAPSGAVMAFNLSTCPSWRKPADGTNGTPDLRGEFIRWLDNWRGVDTWRVISSAQWDSINRNNFNTYSPYAYWNLSMKVYWPTNWSIDQWWTAYSTYNWWLSKWLWNETRPRNVALLYCIKE